MKEVSDWSRVYEGLKRQNWIILLILSFSSFFFMSNSFTLGLILGGFIIIINFNLLQHTISLAFFSEESSSPSKFIIIAKSLFRLLILGSLVAFSISFKWIDTIGLAVGLSIVCLSIFSTAVFNVFHIKTKGAV